MTRTLTPDDLPGLTVEDLQAVKDSGSRVWVGGVGYEIRQVLGVYRGDRRVGWKAVAVADDAC